VSRPWRDDIGGDSDASAAAEQMERWDAVHTPWSGSSLGLIAMGAAASIAATAVVIVVVVLSLIRTRRRRDEERDA
jgi:hypothetical protein